MKPLLFISIAVFALLQPSQASLSVIDITQIRSNLFSAQRQFTQTIIHGKNQIEQIRQLAQQIDQAQIHLKRLGDPKKVTIETLNEALIFLNQLELNLSSEDIIEGLDPEEIFVARPSGPYQPVARDIRINGEIIAQRDAAPFAPEAAARRSLNHYRQVRSATLDRRRTIKRELDTTLRQLATASTASEIQKLNIVSRNLEAQLSAVDQEIAFATSEVVTRYYESEVEQKVQLEAERQANKAAFKTAADNASHFYRLPNRPVLFKR